MLVKAVGGPGISHKYKKCDARFSCARHKEWSSKRKESASNERRKNLSQELKQNSQVAPLQEVHECTEFQARSKRKDVKIIEGREETTIHGQQDQKAILQNTKTRVRSKEWRRQKRQEIECRNNARLVALEGDTIDPFPPHLNLC